VSDPGGERRGLLGDRAVAFWTVVGGLVAIVTLAITIATLRGGSPSPGPSPSFSQSQPPGPSPSPSPTPSPVSAGVYFNYNDASPYPCADENNIHSVGSGPTVSFSFYNQSTKQVQIYWMNGSGARVFYDTLAPNGNYSVNTQQGQVWLITDNQFNCLDLFYVNSAGEITVKDSL
jgi:hypothetical protein